MGSHGRSSRGSRGSPQHLVLTPRSLVAMVAMVTGSLFSVLTATEGTGQGQGQGTLQLCTDPYKYGICPAYLAYLALPALSNGLLPVPRMPRLSQSLLSA